MKLLLQRAAAAACLQGYYAQRSGLPAGLHRCSDSCLGEGMGQRSEVLGRNRRGGGGLGLIARIDVKSHVLLSAVIQADQRGLPWTARGCY